MCVCGCGCGCVCVCVRACVCVCVCVYCLGSGVSCNLGTVFTLSEFWENPYMPFSLEVTCISAAATVTAGCCVEYVCRVCM